MEKLQNHIFLIVRSIKSAHGLTGLVVSMYDYKWKDAKFDLQHLT